MEIIESHEVLRLLYQIGSLSQWRMVGQKQFSMIPSKLLMSYTIIVLLISVAMLGHSIFDFEDLKQTTDNGIGIMVTFIQMIGIRIAHIVSLIEALLRTKEEMKFFLAVREIDRLFERSLGIKIDNCLFQRRALQRGAVMLIVYLGSQICIWTMELTLMHIQFSYFWIFHILPYLVSGLRYFQIFNAILIIKDRFDQLTKAFSHVNINIVSPTPDSQDFAFKLQFISKELGFFGKSELLNRYEESEKSEIKLLLTIRDIYNRLWELNCIINNCFGISMLINVANDFIAITSTCYWIFISFKEYSSSLFDFLLIAGSAVSSLPHLLNVLVLAIICEKTVKSTTNIALELHNIKTDLLNDNHNTLIEQFSMQLLPQKLAFTAAGFFNVDCTLLYTIIGATTTYLIILIQFHMSDLKQIPK